MSHLRRTDMRTHLLLVFTLALGAFSGAQARVQGGNDQGSAEFEQLKSLVGIWEGVMPAKKGEGEAAEEPPAETMKMRVEYRLTAGGSVIQETFNGGTPMEMITMYHDTQKGLRLTHYCMLGNQPGMDYTGARDGALHFTLSEDSDLDQDKDAFMHSLALTIVDDKNIVQGWTMYRDGEAQSQDIHLTRVK